MGNVVYMMSVSADGYTHRPDGDISWNRVDEELHQHFNDVLRGMSAFVSGRVTYELMADYWPTAGNDPDSSPTEVEFAGIWLDAPKVVYSTTLTSAGWGTVVESSVSPDTVRALTERGDVALGGPTLAATFLAMGLVDEIRMYVHPVAIGEGVSMYPPGVSLDLALRETRTFGNGVVLLRHDVVRT